MKYAVKLEPRIYTDTLTDGRGGIFNWVPEYALKEFNFMFYNKGIKRGNHYHPHFHEYMLLTSGEGYQSQAAKTTRRRFIYPQETVFMFRREYPTSFMQLLIAQQLVF